MILVMQGTSATPFAADFASGDTPSYAWTALIRTFFQLMSRCMMSFLNRWRTAARALAECAPAIARLHTLDEVDNGVDELTDGLRLAKWLANGTQVDKLADTLRDLHVAV